jgi:hypothetical protein
MPSLVTASAPSGEQGAPGWTSFVGRAAVVGGGRGAGASATVVGVGAGSGGAVARGTADVVVTPALGGGVTTLGKVVGATACVVVVARAVAVVSRPPSRRLPVAAAPRIPMTRRKATIGPARRAQRGQPRYVCHRFASRRLPARCAPPTGASVVSSSVGSSGDGGCHRPFGARHQPAGGAPRCQRQLASIHQLACASLIIAFPSRSPARACLRGCRERTLPSPTDDTRQSVSGVAGWVLEGRCVVG